ncbi:MAG: chemotaxis protein CheC [Nitrospirae bacterium]|nr:chemotaxis protein CheC [Nitrospirota bacterium]MBF0592679.1 chemotaxis protein CheC [Nitrospirota bacterium]
MILTTFQIDALTELINIGVGRAAGVLNEMLMAHISLQVPSIRLIERSNIRQEIEGLFNKSYSIVRMEFRGPFSGIASLIFPQDSAANLIGLLLGDLGLPSDMDSIRIGTLLEVGNIVLNGVMGSLSNILRTHVEYSIPIHQNENLYNIINSNNILAKPVVLLARTRFKIETKLIEGDIVLIFEVGSFENLINELNSSLDITQ